MAWKGIPLTGYELAGWPGPTDGWSQAMLLSPFNVFNNDLDKDIGQFAGDTNLGSNANLLGVRKIL